MERSPYYQFSVYLVASPLTTDHWLCKWCSFYLCDRYCLKKWKDFYVFAVLLASWVTKERLNCYVWELIGIELRATAHTIGVMDSQLARQY